MTKLEELKAAADAAREAAWDAADASADADYAEAAYRDELKKQEENDK